MTSRAPAIPGFRVLRPLGQGGMGSVLLVEPASLPGAQRALKLLTVGDPERRARFLREAALLARVDRCPGVVRVHDAGEHEGLLWLCMEYVEGRDLGRVLAERGPLPWEEATRLVRDLALGLAEIHARGVVHRDVKPQNVVVDAAGTAYLVDFGVAQATDLERLTLTGMAMGTPAYFSPEQTSGRPVDGKSDVYSLGVTLYELLTGTVPFPDDVPLGALVRAILHERPEPPGVRRPEVPAGIDRAVLAALEKDPARRPDAAAFAAMLDAGLRRPRGATTGERLARFAARRGPRRAALLGLALLPGLGLALAALLVPGGGPTGVTTAPSNRSTEASSTPPTASPRHDGGDAGALRELVTLLERGEGLRALGWLNARRDARGGQRRAMVEAAPAVEVRARTLAVAAVTDPGGDVDGARALVEVVERLRELSPTEDPGEDLARAALVTVRAAAQGAHARRAQPGELDERVALLAAVGAARVRSGDRELGEAARDALVDARAEGVLDGETYVAALVALTELDVALEHPHIARGHQARAAMGGGPAGELLRLRLDLALQPLTAKEAVRRRLLDLVTGERGRGFGPVTRARALCLGLHDGVRPGEALALAREACELDPSSPIPRLALAHSLLALDAPASTAEAVEAVDAAATLFENERARRGGEIGSEQALALGTAVRLYARAGRDDRARALIEELRRSPHALPEWIGEMERMRRLGGGAPRDF